MKITLLTTLSGLIETTRIKEEVEARGDSFFFVDLKDFQYQITKDGLQIPEMETLLSSDIVIARGIFSSVKSITSIINYLSSKGVKVFDNNLSAHPYSIDKVTDILKLALHDVPTPITAYARSFDEYTQYTDNIGYPVVIKATRMGKGAGVYKFDSKDAVTAFVSEQRTLENNAKSFLIQEFVEYEHDLRVLVIGDSMFAMKRIPQEGEFRANFSLGGSVELFPLTDEIRALAKQAIAAVGLEVAGVDVLIDKSGRKYILEVNHTPGFEGMEQATHENIGKLFVEQAINSSK